MSRRIFYYSILSLSIAACSGNDARRATGDFEYANKQEASVIKVPENLNKPVTKNDFEIVDEAKVSGPTGAEVDVRAPSLVLPVAASSRVVTQSSDAIIWFDKVLEDKDLKVFIVDAIKKEVSESGTTIESESADGLTLTTGWIHREKEEGVLLKDTVLSESKKFDIIVGTKPHGRSVSVQVKLVDYMLTNKSGSTKQADPIDQVRAEMAMLNAITSQVDYTYRLQQRENHLLRASQKIVSLAENNEGEAAYLVEMELELLWQNLPIFFERHGFKVADINESKHIYFVDFVKPETSIWDSIWGDEVPVVDLENRKYQFVLSKKESSSFVTIYDEDGLVLNEDKLELIFPVMEPGLSFRDL
ncbi:outer membrane protein assembly factor BamC [Thalassotalea atypica]|uniref:outer membrane protein assembly factor BamC n=1 Tax=Thalassotalea atypica TaxID=2054316 RepID=UPI00257360B1|nr:outer membrane protein assembly factor BamC [Thalassotalea atypica]